MGDDTQKVDRRVRKALPCAYCGGERSGRDEDHVVPRCLFGQPRPADMLVVPVCKACNDEKSRDDDYLRDMLVLNFQAAANPSRAEPFEKMRRSVRANKSVVGRVARAQGRWKAEYTPAGIYLGHAINFPLDTARVDRLFARMVRGLYYWVTRERFTAGYDFDVRGLHPLYVDEVAEQLRHWGHNRLPIGDAKVFDSLFVIDGDDPFLTRWLLRFYGGIFVTVCTDPPAAVVPQQDGIVSRAEEEPPQDHPAGNV